MLALDHIQIAMPKGVEDQARTFWVDLVGLREIEKPEPLRARGGLWLLLAGAELHLGVEEAFVPSKKAHPGLVTRDIDALAETLSAAGHDVRWDEELNDRRRFFTDDPFGNRLEFLTAPRLSN